MSAPSAGAKVTSPFQKKKTLPNCPTKKHQRKVEKLHSLITDSGHNRPGSEAQPRPRRPGHHHLRLARGRVHCRRRRLRHQESRCRRRPATRARHDDEHDGHERCARTACCCECGCSRCAGSGGGKDWTGRSERAEC